MANKTFDELNALSTPDTSDLVAIADVDASNEAKKTTVGELATTISTELSLGTAATTASTDYATAAQGATADTALQPSDNISELTNDENYVSSDALTTTSVSGNVNAGSIVDVIALNQDQYDNRTVGANDDKTLFVITDGKTKDSYVGQIDTLESKTYTIDPYVVSDRDISRIYVAWTGTAGGTIDIQVNGVTAGSQIALTGTSPSNQDLSGSPVSVTAGQVITLVAASVDTITNVLFTVEYEV